MNIRIRLIFNWGGETWIKYVVTTQPRKYDLIQDGDLEWVVDRVTHFTNGEPLRVEISEINLKTTSNIHWELGHERGWNLEEGTKC